jgi:hypothetical protein
MPFGDSKESLTVAQKQLHNILCKKPTNEGIPESSLKIASARGNARLSRIQGSKAVLQTDGSTSGSELSSVNVDLSSQLQERLYAESALAQKLTSVEISMPTNPFKLPVATSRPQFGLIAEGATSSGLSDNVGTANVTLDTFKLVGVSEYSYEVDEDSVLAILPIITNQLSSSAADALEDAIINGDTTTTHQDTDTDGGAGTLPAKACKGLRKLGLGVADVDAGAATMTPAMVGSMRAGMGVYGLRPQDLALIVSIEDYNNLLVHDDISQYRLWGDGNSINNGNLAQVWGIDVIPSGQMRTDLDENGVNGAAGNTHGAAVLMHVPSFVVGTRREFTVEVDTDKYKQTNAVIAAFRRDFQPIGTPNASNFSTISVLKEIGS